MLTGTEAVVRKASPGKLFFRRTFSRMRSMGVAWALIGMLVGVSNAIHIGGGTLNLLAQVFAAVVLFSLQGLLLGVVFDSRRESVIGSVIGLIVAIIAMLAGLRVDTGCLPSIGLAAGGLFGATICPFSRLVSLFVRCVSASLQAVLRKIRHPGTKTITCPKPTSRRSGNRTPSKTTAKWQRYESASHPSPLD